MSERRVVTFCLVLATLAKLALAALTHGTNDVDTFYNFGVFIRENGLAAMYSATPEFNHLPITGWYCALIVGLPGFYLLLRLPGIVADVFTVRAILRIERSTGRPGFVAVALYAMSPVSILVSGFHGNIDSVMVLFLVLAAEACLRGEGAKCGVWLACAANIKIIALLLAPAFAFHWIWRRSFSPFAFASIGVALLGWSYPLLVVPGEFLRHVAGYSSNWGSWGISYCLRATGWMSFQTLGFTNLTAPQEVVNSLLKLVIIGGAFWVAWVHRARQLWSTLSLTWLLFLVFAPGVGAQYLVWPSPFLLMASRRSFVAVTAASAIFLAVFYHVISRGRWYFANSTADLVPAWVHWSVLPWMTCLVVLIVWKRLGSPDEADRV